MINPPHAPRLSLTSRIRNSVRRPRHSDSPTAGGTGLPLGASANDRHFKAAPLDVAATNLYMNPPPTSMVSPVQMGELIAPVGPLLAPYQPAQRCFVLDERRVEADDLPSRNRMSAVVGLEQSRSLSDVARVAEELAAWLPDLQVRRAFADWMRHRGAAGAEWGGAAADTEVGGREYDVGGTSGRMVQGVAEGRAWAGA